MVVGHGLDDRSVLYRGKIFVSSMSGLTVGPTLHPVVWSSLPVGKLVRERHLNAHLVREHHLNAHLVGECRLNAHLVRECHLNAHLIREHSLNAHLVRECRLNTHVVRDHCLNAHLVRECHLNAHVVREHHLNAHMVRECCLNTHVHPVPRLRTSGAIPLLPLYCCMVWTGTALPLPFTFIFHMMDLWLVTIHFFSVVHFG